MEAGWDSSSFGEGTLECLLCKEPLDYVNYDSSDLMNHLNDVHKTKIHQKLILAITFMENKTLNKIINQFEKETKSVGVQIADIFGIDYTDEGLLEETENVLDSSVVEIAEEKDAVLVEYVDENEVESLEEEVVEKELDYEEIIKSSEYFKQNPKQLTKKCNIELPSGWKMRDHEKQNGESEKHYLAPDGRVIKSKRAVIEYMKIMEKYSVKNIISVPETKTGQFFGSLWNNLSSNETSSKSKIPVLKKETTNINESLPKKRGRPSLSSKVDKQHIDEENEPEDDSEKVSDMKKRRSGVGTECPKCHKFVTLPKQHMEDMHSPPGHFPCRGGAKCGKVFTSKNKESSHYSRHCNPNKKK